MDDSLSEKKNIGALFNRIAGHYDPLNHLLSAGVDKRWRRKAIRAARPCQGEWLDVAIGTADLALEALRQGKARSVTGVDLSEEMMRIGREKAGKAGVSGRVRFMQANCEQLPFADGTFMTVSCAYGVRNFRRLDECLREMFRVTAPGGELVILEFSYPDNRLIRAVYDFYFSRVLPWAGGLLSRDKSAYRYLNRSVKGFVWGQSLCDRIAAAGFADTRFEPLTFGISTLYRAVKP